MQKRLLQNKTAIITGCNRGIGLEILKTFAVNGANIFACARSYNDDYEQMLRELEKEYQVKIEPVYFDLTEEKEIKDAITSIFRKKVTIDILVNNAGVPYGASFQMTSISKLKEIFEINYFSQIKLMQLLSRQMMKQKSGSIINMASVGGIEAEPGYLAYGSSKAALIWATKCLAKEVGVYGVRVNAVAPGLTDTSMGHFKSEEEMKAVLARTPMARMAKPKEIADVVLFLASEEASYITGQIIQVDGGRAI